MHFVQIQALLLFFNRLLLDLYLVFILKEVVNRVGKNLRPVNYFLILKNQVRLDKFGQWIVALQAIIGPESLNRSKDATNHLRCC